MQRTCDILIPTYNRKKFSELIRDNINKQTYPFINKIIIADDGERDQQLEFVSKYPVDYYRVKRMSIGAKRNFLKSKSNAYFIANMDTDDVYHKDYISSCVFNMILTNKHISGSADMLLEYKNDVYIHRCIYLHLLNEATIVCINNQRQYGDTNSGEGRTYLQGLEPNIVETDIRKIMICLVHGDNTVSKMNHLKHKCERPDGFHYTNK